MRDVTTRRPSPLSNPIGSGRRARAIGALLVAVVIAASCGTPNGTVPPVPGTTPVASGEAVATATPGSPAGSATPSPSPTAPPTVWTRVTPADLPRVATLEPTRRGSTGVALDTSFTLTSLDGRAPADLAAHLVAEPPLAFTVASTSGATAVVKPAAVLRAGTLYRISLRRGDGSVEATWAAQAASPLAVTDSVPGNEASLVPVDTGIEVTFNQSGVSAADFEAHFRISPATTGRFIASGRTLVFLPAKALAKGRVYTVTLTHGLPLAGTGQVLADDVVIRFETSARVRSSITVGFYRSVVEATARERASIAVWVDKPETKAVPASLPITVHRLPSLEAAMNAAKAIEAAPDFTRASATPAVSTSGLSQRFKGSVRLRAQNDWGDNWIQLPDRLTTGWYLVTESWAGIPRQVVVQVTDLATFTMTTTTTSMTWVNNLGTGAAVAGASVAIDGRVVGTTDERGVMEVATPATLRADDDPWSTTMLVVRSGDLARFEWLSYSRVCGTCASGHEPEADDWWRTFTSDRGRYRATDTMHLWGVVRDRSTGTVPASATIDLLTASDGGSDTSIPVRTATVHPDETGAFTASLSFTDLPVGSYYLRLTVGGTAVSELWTEIATITKPAWRLTATAAHRALLSGRTVPVAVTAGFFEGTPVAGARIGLTDSSENDGEEEAPPEPVVVTSGTDGAATGQVPVTIGAGDEQWQYTTIEARPTTPEEGDITASAEVVVFRATALIDAGATVSGTRLTATGTVCSVDFAAYDRPGVNPWEVDPHGATRADAAVRVKVIESVPVRRQTGTTYDFIAKKVVPVYEYDTRETTVATRTVRTTAAGTFRTAFTIRGGNRSYRIEATYADEDGRRVTASTWADERSPDDAEGYPFLENANAGEDDVYAVGDTVRVRVTDPAGAPAGARYLYAITHRGLRYVAVGTAPTFRTTFSEAWVPGFEITAVRFTTRGYATFVTGYQPRLQLDDRRLAVTVTTDKARYAPGATANVSIRTLGPGGTPVAATVFVTAVDEKLYEIGAAFDTDPLADLYVGVGSGITGTQHSHQTPDMDWGGKGDTTGGGDGDGGDRSDFRDWLIASLVRTNADGRATVAVPLSDDLTSWHVTASAVDRDLQAGQGTGRLAVGLPFFVDATLAAEYLSVDRPVVRVRAFGDGLTAGETVTFSVSSDTLPMAPVTVTATAFSAAEVALPALSLGTHRVRIEARAGSGATLRTDTLVRTFQVITTRATQVHTAWSALSAPTAVSSGPGFTTLVLADGGRGRVIPLLQVLSEGEGGRSDRLVAAALANRVLADAFGLDPATPTDATALQPYVQYDGIAVVPYGSSQLEATVLAALAGEDRFDWAEIHTSLGEIAADPGEVPERRLLALAGLAALGDGVLDEVRNFAARTDLAPDQQVLLALAALAAGDEDLAGQLERRILADHALRQGPWVRLEIGTGDGPIIATARLAIVAAALGDPIAAEMDAWLAGNPPLTTTVDVERALAAQGWARRVAGGTAAAAITVDGNRREFTLEPGQPVTVTLTPSQAVGARLEPVSGSPVVITSWVEPLSALSLTPAKGQSLVRTVKPSGTIGETDLVEVTLTVVLGSAARDECWRVTDLVPSGLAPIAGAGEFIANDEGDPIWAGTSPDRVDGQRVEFCVTRKAKVGTVTLRYVARVVTPGTYLWEPAVLQSAVVPDQGVVTPRVTVTITGG